jgi:hypothetical protein
LFLAFLLLKDRLNTVWVALFGIAIFFCHASTFLAFVLLVAFAAVLKGGRRRDLIALIPGIMLMIWYLLAKQKLRAESDLAEQLYSGILPHLEYKVYTLAKIGPFQNLIDSQRRSLLQRNHLLYLTGSVINFFFVGILCLSFVRSVARQSIRSLFSPAIAVSSVLLVGFLILPSSSLGVVNLGERLLYPAVLLLIFHLRDIPYLRLICALMVVSLAINASEFLTMPSIETQGPAAYHVETHVSSAAKHRDFGLFSHEIYVHDSRRAFLVKPDESSLPELRFDTSDIQNQHR